MDVPDKPLQQMNLGDSSITIRDSQIDGYGMMISVFTEMDHQKDL